MAEHQVTRETLKAMAALLGLTLSDEKLEQLLPQVQRAAKTLAELDALDMESVEPAIIFTSDRG
ncbi:MAG: hypothetical protein ACRDIB_08670 [Ardenticatenaceae bacterium]